MATAERSRRSQLRQFEARQLLYAHVAKRRGRDQVLWSLGAVVAVVVSSLSLFAYTAVGPGAPATVPDQALSENRTWSGQMDFGDVALDITLDGGAAPQAVANLVSLIDDSFYEGLTCHRLTTEEFLVMQCGDPLGLGLGGPGYVFGPVENDPADGFYPAGTLAMARATDNGQTMGSQFFIVYEDSTIPNDAAGGYTVMGRITSGLDQFIDAYVTPGTADESVDGPPLATPVMETITIR